MSTLPIEHADYCFGHAPSYMRITTSHDLVNVHAHLFNCECDVCGRKDQFIVRSWEFKRDPYGLVLYSKRIPICTGDAS